MMVAAPLPEESPDEAIDRLCRELTSPTNEIASKAVKERFAAWLTRHPRTLTTRAANVAGSMVESFFRRRRPNLGAGQLGLFRPEGLVPLGNGKRAWMDDLSRDQFQAWEEIETKAFTQTRSAYDGKILYWQDRRDHWGLYTTLGALERAEYGYVDPDISYDDESADEDDDS